MTRFLSQPHAGWSHLELGNFSIGVSYLTDVPYDCLKAACIALESDTDFCVNFETEGKGDVKVISDDYKTYIIHEIDPIRLIVVEDITKYNLCIMTYNDIKEYLSDWACWNILSDKDDKIDVLLETHNTEVKLQNMLDRIRRLLHSQKYLKS